MDTGGNLSITGGLSQASDSRIKTNIAVIPGAGEKIDGIRGVTFNRIDLDDGNRTYAGLIAQDVQAVLPCGVTTDGMTGSDGNPQAAVLHVDPTAIIGLLVEAVKDLRVRVASLERGQQ
jgi:hypothetical protein